MAKVDSSGFSIRVRINRRAAAFVKGADLRVRWGDCRVCCEIPPKPSVIWDHVRARFRGYCDLTALTRGSRGDRKLWACLQELGAVDILLVAGSMPVLYSTDSIALDTSADATNRRYYLPCSTSVIFRSRWIELTHPGLQRRLMFARRMLSQETLARLAQNRSLERKEMVGFPAVLSVVIATLLQSGVLQMWPSPDVTIPQRTKRSCGPRAKALFDGRTSTRSFVRCRLDASMIREVCGLALHVETENTVAGHKRLLSAWPYAGRPDWFRFVVHVGDARAQRRASYLYQHTTGKFCLCTDYPWSACFEQEVASALGNGRAWPPVVLYTLWDADAFAQRYGVRAPHLANMTAGGILQSLYLACTSLGLGGCALGIHPDRFPSAKEGGNWKLAVGFAFGKAARASSKQPSLFAATSHGQADARNR